MAQSFQGQQRRMQISLDVFKQMAEIQKLRQLIRLAEDSERSRGQSTLDRSIIAPPAGRDLRS
jgi:hypothetical protein